MRQSLADAQVAARQRVWAFGSRIPGPGVESPRFSFPVENSGFDQSDSFDRDAIRGRALATLGHVAGSSCRIVAGIDGRPGAFGVSWFGDAGGFPPSGLFACNSGGHPAPGRPVLGRPGHPISGDQSVSPDFVSSSGSIPRGAVPGPSAGARCRDLLRREGCGARFFSNLQVEVRSGILPGRPRDSDDSPVTTSVGDQRGRFRGLPDALYCLPPARGAIRDIHPHAHRAVADADSSAGRQAAAHGCR